MENIKERLRAADKYFEYKEARIETNIQPSYTGQKQKKYSLERAEAIPWACVIWQPHGFLRQSISYSYHLVWTASHGDQSNAIFSLRIKMSAS